MSARVSWLFPAFVALGTGCAAEPKPAVPGAPYQVSARQTGFDEIELSWKAPAGTHTGFEINARAGGDAWQSLAPAVPGSVDIVLVILSPTFPELLELSFRVRAVNQDVVGVWSLESSVFRTLRPPADAAATLDEAERPRITWRNETSASTGTRILRQVGTDPYFGEVVAELPIGVTSWVDYEAEIPGAYQYRLLHTAGDWVSSPAQVAVMSPGLVLPAGLRAEGGPGAVTLSWTNRSRVATSIVIGRTGVGTVATLPADATSFTETGLVPGQHVYSLQVKDDQGHGRAIYRVLGVALPGADWTAERLFLPDAVVVHGPDGHWYAPEGLVEGGKGVYRLEHGGWELVGDVASDEESLHPLLLFDGLGNPHAVFAHVYYYPRVELRHGWHDGASWQVEGIVTGTQYSAYSALTFGVTGEGGIHVLSRSDGSDFLHETVEGASWVAARLSGSPLLFAVAPDGHAYLPSREGEAVAVRAPGASWVLETLPSSPPVMGPAVAIVGASDGQVDLVDWRGTWIRRNGGAWGPSESGLVPPSSGCPAPVLLAVSAPRGRVAAACGPNLAVREPESAEWVQLAFGDSLSHLWFDAAERLHVVASLAVYFTGPTEHLHFAEP